MSEPELTPDEIREIALRIDPVAIRAGLKKLADDPEIGEFLRDLLTHAASIALARDSRNKPVGDLNLLKIYDIVLGQDGIRRGNRNRAMGFVSQGNAGIILGTSQPGFKTRSAVEQFVLKKDITFVLHETLHHAGTNTYTDEDYARAVCLMLGTTIEEALKTPEERDINGFSNFWNTELKRRCRL